jgi:hypothetical protein
MGKAADNELEGAARTRWPRGRRCEQGLELCHRPARPNAPGAVFVSVCLSHHKSLADPSLRVLLLHAKNLRSATHPLSFDRLR